MQATGLGTETCRSVPREPEVLHEGHRLLRHLHGGQPPRCIPHARALPQLPIHIAIKAANSVVFTPQYPM